MKRFIALFLLSVIACVLCASLALGAGVSISDSALVGNNAYGGGGGCW